MCWAVVALFGIPIPFFCRSHVEWGYVLRRRRRKVWLLPQFILQGFVGKVSSVYFLTIVLILLAFTLGGSSQAHMIGNTFVQAAAVIALVAFLPRVLSADWSFMVSLTLTGLFLLCLMPLLHLVPLPESLWANLPGRARLTELSGLEINKPAFRLFSVSPAATIQSFFFMLIPAAVFLGVLLMDFDARRKACIFILSFTLFSILLGAMQMFSGTNSPLYLYSFTNFGSPVGFFSNRNHFAALLYCSLPLIIAFALAPRGGGKQGRRHHPPAREFFVPLALISTILLLVLGVALTASRAGIGLAFLAIIATFTSLLLSGVVRIRSKRIRGVSAIFIVAAASAAFYGLDSLISRFDTNFSEDLRHVANQVTWQGIANFFPFGSGMGTFRPVYKLFESIETLQPKTMNRAHNEYFEWLLEAGVFAIILLVLTVIWLVVAIVRAWTSIDPRQTPTDRNLIFASAIVPCLLLIHSAVDYPLRTATIAAVAAFCCAMTIPPLTETKATTDGEH